MAVSVTVHHSAFGSDRIADLARRGKYADYEHALGKMTVLWGICTELQTSTPPIQRIRSALGRDDGDEILVASGLGRVLSEGVVYVCGTHGRIEWYGDLPSQQKAAGKARAATAARAPNGAFLPKTAGAGAGASGVQRSPSGSQRSPSDAPRSLSSSDQPAGAAGASAGPAHPAVIQRQPAQEQEYLDRESDIRSSSSGASSVPDPSNGRRLDHDPEAAPIAQPSDDRQQLQLALFTLHQTTFQAIRDELGMADKVPAMRPAGMSDGAERALRELMIARGWGEDFAARARHAIAIQADNARRKRTLMYFGAGMWRDDNFDRVQTMALGEARATPRTGRFEPMPPSSYPDGEVDL